VTNILIFKMLCGVCKREILDGMLYCRHDKYGYVCEYCIKFKDGGIEVVPERLQ
jgi:hypothetical protein